MSFCQLLGWRPGTDLIQKYSTHCVGIAFFVTVGLVSQKKPLCFLLHLGCLNFCPLHRADASSVQASSCLAPLLGGMQGICKAACVETC